MLKVKSASWTNIGDYKRLDLVFVWDKKTGHVVGGNYEDNELKISIEKKDYEDNELKISIEKKDDVYIGSLMIRFERDMQSVDMESALVIAGMKLQETIEFLEFARSVETEQARR